MNREKIIKGVFVILLTEQTSCGCDVVLPGTVGRIREDGLDEDDQIVLEYCNDGCKNYVELGDVTTDNFEQEELAEKFKASHVYHHARVDLYRHIHPDNQTG